MDEEFCNMQEAFCLEHCAVFENTEENKLCYTDIFTRYTEVIEGFLAERLTATIEDFDMEEFGSYCLDFRLDGRYDLHSWGGARQDCNKYGMTMLQIGGETKDEFINQKLVESGLFSQGGDAFGIWIGAQGGQS